MASLRASHLHQPHPVRHRRARLGAVLGRGEEDRRAVVAGADHLLGDAADGADLPRVVDGPGAGDELAARQRPRRQLVHDAEREHQAGARAADVLQRDLHGERVGRLVPGDDADHRAAVVGGGRRGHRRASRCGRPGVRRSGSCRPACARSPRRAATPRRSPASRRPRRSRRPCAACPRTASRPAGPGRRRRSARGCRATAARPSWRSPASRSSRRCSAARPPGRTRPWGRPSPRARPRSSCPASRAAPCRGRASAAGRPAPTR